MTHLSSLVHAVARFFVIWAVDGLSLWGTAALIPGFVLHGEAGLERLFIAFGAAFLLGFVNLLLRPLVLMLARPLGFIALFIIGFFVNALALLATSWLMPAFDVTSLGWAIVGGILFTAINTVLTGILELDDEGSFYQGRVERQAKNQTFSGASEPGRGLVMLEIDGLSYHHLHKAIADGRLPTMREMMEEEGYEISLVDCGLPSQTSACQAGILFGDNHDIPAFRWYDKAEGRLFVSGSDAGEINARYSTGNGLLRGGSSIDNMLDGDAEKSLLTVSNLLDADPEEKKRRAEDIYLLMLNPYFLMRTLVFFLVDVVRELWQYSAARLRNEEPRLNRLAHAYPFVRAGTTTFVRDVARQLAVLDIIRGAPAIYVTWPGYDEVAHHSGPWSDDAFGVLAKYDHVIRHLRRVIHEKAPRPYDLVVLSDHGQSFGPTFKQRYGMSIKGFIESLLPHGTTITQSVGGDTGAPSIHAVSSELGNVADQGIGDPVSRNAAKHGQRVLGKGKENVDRASGSTDEDQQAQVTAYGSGNLAQVYFDLYPRKITLSELEQAYPGMVGGLVEHEGIGVVCGYEDDGTPVAIGKSGRRNLHTDEVTGDDPLLPYAPADPTAYGHSTIEVRSWQVRRVMDFPSAGDLMLISTVYPDGTVAALEELIGNHGGMGGEQTDAFLFHPPDMEVGATRNSIDMFSILDGHRGTPVPEGPRPGAVAPRADEEPWSRENVVGGLRDVKHWVGLALRALVLDRHAYQKIVADPRMTAPGLLLGLAFATLAAVVRAVRAVAEVGETGATQVSGLVREGSVAGVTDTTGLIGVLSGWLAWLIAVLIIYAVGRMLTRKGTYSRTMRAMGFAQVTSVLSLLTLVPHIATLSLLIRVVVSFFAWWMAAAEAHETKGWRTVALPILALAAIVFVPLLVEVLLGSAVLSISSVLDQVGLTQQ